MPVPARAAVRLLDTDGTVMAYLAEYAPVVALKWSFTVNGPDQMSCVAQLPASARCPALETGRGVQVCPGPGGWVWEGVLDEPAPGPDGWAVTAHGIGAPEAGCYRADYSGAAWGATSPRRAVDNAIGRGLRWVRGGGLDPLPDGAWLGQAPDQASDSLADLLDLVCSRGALNWQVTCGPGGNVLTVAAPPTAVTRLLVATSPVPRTVAEQVRVVCIRYCTKKDDDAGTASYAITYVDSGRAGGKEAFLDLGSATKPGTGDLYSLADVRDIGAYCLAHYTEATWGGPFTVAPGQYLSATGQPVALSHERQGEVARLLLADYGGQAQGGPAPVFAVGGYEFDDETGLGTVTPAGSVLTDWSSLVSSMTEYRTARGDPFGLQSGAA